MGVRGGPPGSREGVRFRRVAAREGLLLATAAAGAFLFVNHENLYRLTSWTWGPASPAGYLAATVVFYAFARVLLRLAPLYVPASRAHLVRCPECGRALQDPSRKGVRIHHREALSRKPSEKEVLAAIMLRKAIDDARRSAKRPLVPPNDPRTSVPGDVENPPLSPEEFERILRELDFLREGRGRGLRFRGPRDPSN